MIRTAKIASGVLLFSALLSASITTTTTLTSVTPAAPEFGQKVTMAATISPPTVSGSVSFMDNAVLIGTAKVNASGIAEATTLTLPVGRHSIIAVFGGDTSGGYGASQSAALPYIVTPVPGSGFAAAVKYPTDFEDWVTVGDFNGDGKPDLAVADFTGSKVGVLLGNGDGTFKNEVTYPVGNTPEVVTVGDFNGDGKPDLAVSNLASNSVSILLGNGDGTFQPAVNYSTGTEPVIIAVGDFNGDGMADLAIANYGGNNVSVLLGVGDGTFHAAVNYASGTGPESVVVGDFNGDGKSDLAVANYTSNNVSILLGNGDGTFQPAVNYAAGTNSIIAAVGDFNGDGVADLAVSYAGGVSVLLGKGDGTFQPAVNHAFGTGSIGVSIGDFNGDGKPDLVTGNDAANTVSILLGNGDGTFQAPVDYAAGTSPVNAAVADFNGDGIADLAVSDNGGGVSGGGGVRVLLGTAPPSTSISLVSSVNPSIYGHPVTLTATVAPSGAPGIVEFLDGTTVIETKALNLSGQAQIATSLLPSGSNAVSAVYGGAPGDWQPSQSTVLHQVVNPVAAVSLAASVNYASGSQPISVAAGDFNGNGKADLAVANNGSNNVSILLGNGDGTFKAAVDYAVGTLPAAVAAGDFNGDGKPDLAVANFSTDNVSILLGNGDGTFSGPVNYASNTHPQSLVVADFNGDGKPDLATANNGDNTVSVLLGNGDGTFQLALNFGTGTEPISVAVGDFNGDGIADLTVANNGNGSVSVLLGNGDGTFRPRVNYATAGPTSVAVGDFNGDGKEDLAVANNTGNASVLLGRGDGTFHAAVAYAAGSGPTSIAVVDFNGDGKEDLAVADVSSGSVNVLSGNGDGTFQPAVSYVAGTSPRSLAVGDFNGDGRADLAVANNGSNNVSILLGSASLPAVPSPVSVGPGSGSGLTQTFTFNFTDASGYADLSVLDILVNNYLDGIGACYVALVPAGASSGYVYLVADAGGGYVSGTPMLLPSSGSLSNSQCTIHGTGSSVVASGDTLTLTLNITFTAGFAGNKIFYMAARSATQNSGWQALGTWNVPGAAVVGPWVGGVTPGRSVSMGQTYTFTFTDSSGYSDLAVLDILTNSFLDGIDACYLAYVPISASNGYLYLVDDAGDGGYASGSPILLSSGGELKNSQCTINTVGSSATASGNSLNLNLPIAFSSSFAGNQVFYLASRNSSTGNSGWQAAGSVTVP